LAALSHAALALDEAVPTVALSATFFAASAARLHASAVSDE
jgi:hypothetical protein